MGTPLANPGCLGRRESLRCFHDDTIDLAPFGRGYDQRQPLFYQIERLQPMTYLLPVALRARWQGGVVLARASVLSRFLREYLLLDRQGEIPEHLQSYGSLKPSVEEGLRVEP